MDINFLAGIATIISTIIGLITLYVLLKDRKQTPNQSGQQGRGSIYIPEHIKRQQLTKGKRRTLFVLASISFLICIVSIGILFGLGRFPPKISTDTPTANSTVAPNPTVTLSLPKWRPLLKQLAPDCNNPKGVAWYVHVNGTFEKCSGSSLLMQRISPQYYADMELIEVNHMTYNQTTFHVQVQVTSQNPGDTGTLAGLLVQTPAQVNAVGGFIFLLSTSGEWQLQDVITGTDIPIVAQGSVSIDRSRPVIIAVAVKDGFLYGYINGKQAVEFPDNLNPLPGEVGLEVQGPAPSSLVHFSNFELDI